jgi:solute carrier family 25 thiamine pyrophosphate transporter 19
MTASSSSTASASAEVEQPASASSSPSSPPVSHSPHWHDLIAGAIAGLGARAITAPLDLLKIRRQLSIVSKVPSSTPISSYVGSEWNIYHHLHTIVKTEGGIRSLFRGNVAASYLWMGYSMTEFWVYGHTSQYLRRQFINTNNNYNHSSKDGQQQHESVKVAGAISFTAGAISGVCATIVTYPFDLCRTIFAARGILPTSPTANTDATATTTTSTFRNRPPRTIYEFAYQTYQQKGLSGYYAGISPGLLQVIPYMGINFALHDTIVVLSESTDSRVSGMAGMIAGVISKFIVYPLDTVKRRLQAQAFYGGGCSSIQQQNTTSTVPIIRSNPSLQQPTVQHDVSASSYKDMIHCFREISKREGFVAFYKGLIPSLLKSSIGTGASFWLFTLTKNILSTWY